MAEITKNDILRLNNELSRSIYENIIKGSYINKLIYDSKDDILVENPEYIEILEHFDIYAFIYGNIGFELINDSETFFLRKKNNIEYTDEEIINPDDNKTEKKIYILLVLIHRFLIESGFSYETLTDINLGFSGADVEGMLKIKKFRNIYDLAQFNKATVEKSMDFYLVKFGILYRTKRGKYVFSNGGMRYLKHTEESGKRVFNENRNSTKN